MYKKPTWGSDRGNRKQGMKKIKAGVIGVGYLGRFHAQKYQALDQVELIGVADTDGDRAHEVAAECSCRAIHRPP